MKFFKRKKLEETEETRFLKHSKLEESEEKIVIEIGIYGEMTVSKGVANYISMIAMYATESARREGRDGLARDFKEMGLEIYDKLKNAGYYD